MNTTYDCVVVGAGPAGLSAALNLGRARHSVLLIDAGRPRNAATLMAHGYLTRDGIPPHELRSIGQAELALYPNIKLFKRTLVTSVRSVLDRTNRFQITIAQSGGHTQTVATPALLLTTGLTETLPELPDIRAFYGMSVFSCVMCDGYELSDRPIAFISETPDTSRWARLISRWSNELTVFTNGSGALSPADVAVLAERGVRVDHRRIEALVGSKGALTNIRLAGGETVAVKGGFVRPQWHPALEFLTDIAPELDDGYVKTDSAGRTTVPGMYAAGDITSPGPQQLIIAAGAGARTAASITDDADSWPSAHRRNSPAIHRLTTQS